MEGNAIRIPPMPALAAVQPAGVGTSPLWNFLMGSHAPGHSTGRAASAFTLVEMLVSLVVIGILSALLLTAFKGARDSSQAMTCTSNLRQIGRALYSYAAEHEGTFPPSRPEGLVWPANTFMYALNPYLENKPSATFQQQKALCYSGVFRCPGKEDWNLNGTEINQFSYGMNTFNTDQATKFAKSTVAITNLSKTLLVADVQATSDCLRNSNYMYVNSKALRHFKKRSDNVLFCDGHVAPVSENGFTYDLILK